MSTYMFAVQTEYMVGNQLYIRYHIQACCARKTRYFSISVNVEGYRSRLTFVICLCCIQDSFILTCMLTCGDKYGILFAKFPLSWITAICKIFGCNTALYHYMHCQDRLLVYIRIHV